MAINCKLNRKIIYWPTDQTNQLCLHCAEVNNIVWLLGLQGSHHYHQICKKDIVKSVVHWTGVIGVDIMELPPVSPRQGNVI